MTGMTQPAHRQHGVLPITLVVGSLLIALSIPSVLHAQPAAPQAQPAPAADSGDPHAGVDGAPALSRPLSSAAPSPELPAGSIRVRVVDEHEQPIAGQSVDLGTMLQDGSRERVSATTDAQGLCVFGGLKTGDGQAYRVSLTHDGAKSGATPFRLPPDHGYDVMIRRLPTTRDARSLVLYVGATSVELRDERLKIVQQVRLFNLGRKTYVFPEGGQLVPLPAGAMAFQADEVMTDQRLVADEQGFRLSGSVPPGEVTLTWGFDLPREGSEVAISFPMPWPTFAYRVLADAAPGLSLEVDGMPPATLESDRGRKFWLTEITKRVGDAPLNEVRIRVAGIPGHGPLRYIATALALLVVGIGLVIARRPPTTDARGLADAFDARQAELLGRVRTLDDEKARGDIGEQFHAAQLAEIEEALAALLHERAQETSK